MTVKRPVQRRRLPKQKALKELTKNPVIAYRELNNRNFHEFVKFMWPEISADEFQDNWHIRYLCDVLQQKAEKVAGEFSKAWKETTGDLIINVPPGTTKTTLVSIMFPVWCWTRWYWMRFITLSYSSSLSMESAETSRELVRSDRFKLLYPELEIKQDKDQKSNFQILKEFVPNGQSGATKPWAAPKYRKGGNRYSTSVGGTLTGFHAHMIIVDDPVNPQQAISERELTNANRWIDHTLPTRKVEKTVTPTISIMQRLHEDDPTGHQLAKGKKNVEHICLPGEIKNYGNNVKPDYLKEYYQDGLLDPIRMNWLVLKDLEADLGQYGYAGQIGQSPTPPSGGMFKPDHIQLLQQLPPLPDIYETVRYWDKAGSEGKGAYTVGVKMCKIRGGKYLITDVKRGQWSSEERERIIKETAEADGKNVVQYIEQEGGSGGKESAESTIRHLAGFTVRTDRPTGDKVYRADPFSVQVNNGNILMLTADWNKDFKDELRFFPHGKYKDQVDASSGAFAKLVSARRAGPLGANRRR